MVQVLNTGGSSLSQNFLDHENLSGLSIIWLISSNLHKIIQAKWESGLTAVWLKWDPPALMKSINTLKEWAETLLTGSVGTLLERDELLHLHSGTRDKGILHVMVLNLRCVEAWAVIYLLGGISIKENNPG